jgi:outer membrane lipoprotein-sorting protein
MKPFRFAIAPLLFALAALPAQAEKLSLKEISTYINSIKVAETTFAQTNADGSRSKGQLFIKRPGRMRFEYAPPEKSLVLASAGTVAIFDDKSNTAPEQYPLKRTPLNLILGDKVNLSQTKMVVEHQEVEGATVVVAQDPNHPEYGTIALYFAPGPELVQWVISDDLGQKTTVKLGPLTPQADYPPSLFAIDLEAEKRGFKAGNN